MAEKRDSDSTRRRTAVNRTSELELVVSRTFDAPAHIVFEAWTRPELFKRWWVPKSIVGMTMLSCEMDVRTGGRYRLEFGHPASEQPVTFLGKYLEVIPNVRLAWTNEEGPDGAVTTVTFDEKQGKTLLTVHERYPTKEALEEALEGSAAAMPEQFAQLEELLATIAP